MKIYAAGTLLGLDAGEWAAIGTWFTGLITVGLLVYAIVQIRDGRKLREDETRPFMVVDFDLRNSGLVSLDVQNIGKSAAAAVRVLLDEPIVSAKAKVDWQTNGLFKEGVPLFAPGRRMTYVIDIFHKRVEAQLPSRVSGVIEYQRAHGRTGTFREPFMIDLSAYGGALLPRKDLADLADEVQKIRKLMEDQGSQRQRLALRPLELNHIVGTRGSSVRRDEMGEPGGQ